MKWFHAKLSGIVCMYIFCLSYRSTHALALAHIQTYTYIRMPARTHAYIHNIFQIFLCPQKSARECGHKSYIFFRCDSYSLPRISHPFSHLSIGFIFFSVLFIMLNSILLMGLEIKYRIAFKSIFSTRFIGTHKKYLTRRFPNLVVKYTQVMLSTTLCVKKTKYRSKFARTSKTKTNKEIGSKNQSSDKNTGT